MQLYTNFTMIFLVLVELYTFDVLLYCYCMAFEVVHYVWYRLDHRNQILNKRYHIVYAATEISKR